MGLVKGLEGFKKAVTPREERESDTPKAKWLSLKDQESVNIRFLQEFEGTDNYNEEDGSILLAVEISDPDNFRRKCLDAQEEEGRSFGWEMHNKLDGIDPNYKGGWRPKERVYANVLVDNGKDAPYVAILSQGVGPKSITPTLVEYANDNEENGNSITDVVFKMKRSGAGFNDTSYMLMPTKATKPERTAEHELYELVGTAVKYVPYAEQAAFFGLAEREIDETADESVSSSVDW